MENTEQNFINLTEFFDKVKRNKLTLLASLALALAAVFLYNRFTTPVYRASAIVSFERFSRDNMLDLDVANPKFLVNFVANRLMELRTRTFAEKVYDQLPDSTRRSYPMPSHLPDDFDRRNYVIEKIRESVLATQLSKESNMITIHFDSEHPRVAARVANTIVRVLHKNNLDFRRKEFSSMKTFIDEQIGLVEKELRRAEDVLRNFKAGDSITSIDDESRELLRRITGAEILHNKIQTEKEAGQKRLELVKNKIAEQKAGVSSSLTKPSTHLVAQLKGRLIERQVEYTNLQTAGYSENHTKMTELKSDIDQLKQKLVRMTVSILQDKSLAGILDPLSNLQKYLEESIRIEMEVETLHAQEGHLEKTLALYNDRLKVLSNKDAMLFGLLRDRAIHNENYIRLLQEREQARLKEAAEIGNIHIIDAAAAPTKPYKPRKRFNMIVATFAGTALGLLLILFKESAMDAPRTEEDVEQILALTVMASVPRIKSKNAFLPTSRSKAPAIAIADGSEPLYRDAYSCLWNYMSRSEGVPRLNGRDSSTRNGEQHDLHSLEYSKNGHHGHRKAYSVMITSAFPGEGKSTTAFNLAYTAARLGKKTVLIDGDIRKPGNVSTWITETIGTSLTDSSLVDILGTTWKLRAENLTTPTSKLLESTMRNLRILSIQDAPAEPDIFWSSPVLGEILASLDQRADLIVIDTLPVLGFPDAISVAPQVDGILLCVEAAQTDAKSLMRAYRILRHVEGNLVGVVLNKVDPKQIYRSCDHKDYSHLNHS